MTHHREGQPGTTMPARLHKRADWFDRAKAKAIGRPQTALRGDRAPDGERLVVRRCQVSENRGAPTCLAASASGREGRIFRVTRRRRRQPASYRGCDDAILNS
jgi:hypothetical protein